MVTPQFLAHILRTFQKWLLRLSRRYTSSLSALLSLLRRFAMCPSKLRVRRSTTQPHLSRGALPQPLGMDIPKEDPYTCSSLLPADEIQEVAREPPSPSDFPYETSPRPSRRIVRDNTSRSLPEATIGYPGAAGTNSHDSRSSLILSVGESPTRYGYATYTKRVRARRVTTIYNPVANIHRRSTDPIAVTLDLSNQTTPVSDPVIGGHNIASPYSHERLGPEQVGPDDGPPIGLLVAEEVGRCEKYTPRSVAIISYINRTAGLKLLKGVLYRPKSLFLR